MLSTCSVSLRVAESDLVLMRGYRKAKTRDVMFMKASLPPPSKVSPASKFQAVEREVATTTGIWGCVV